MTLTFVQLGTFVSRWNRFRLTDDDLHALEDILLKTPEIGVVIPGTGGLRKMRFAPPSRHGGKSGAFRVGYAYFKIASTIYLLAIFPKNIQPNLTASEKADARRIIDAIRKLRRPREQYE